MIQHDLNSFQLIMEKHKLIQLILKDLEELNEIANELRRSEKLSHFELDIALSKSKLVFQEFEFLKELNEGKAENGRFEKEPLPFSNSTSTIAGAKEEDRKEQAIDEEKLQAKAIEKAEPEATPEPQKEAETTKPEAVRNSLEDKEMTQATAPEKVDQPKPEASLPDSEHVKQQEAQPEKEQTESAQSNQEPDEEEVSDIKKTVGENFIKGKSLNDLMLENKTLDKKLASSPITKLETAIGLNDRFQYTRELFNNQPELFRKTVQEIDQAASLNDAVAYLNSNFKWKKTDTSIQFAQLVKRRFIN